MATATGLTPQPITAEIPSRAPAMEVPGCLTGTDWYSMNVENQVPPGDRERETGPASNGAGLNSTSYDNQKPPRHIVHGG